MTLSCGRRRAAGAALLATALTLGGGAGAWAAVAASPSPLTSLRLAGGAYLHLYALPLGLTPAAIVGDVAFDASGTRAVFAGTFPGSAILGDPLRMDPTQAFLLDVSRRRLTQLTVDGLVRGVRWTGPDTIEVGDDHENDVIVVAPARRNAPPTFRFSADQSVGGDLRVVSPETADRLTVYRRGDGRFVVREIGARRLRVNGVSPGGGFALLGENLAWVDSRAGGFGAVDRAGASNSIDPRFDDPYGRQLVSIHPLGRAVYQGAYRDRVAYFAFSYGLTRVVAATRDFVSFSYPPMPDDPAYSVGDGLGALDDGGLYLAWPENLQLTVPRREKFASLSMSFPPGYSDPKPLMSAPVPLPLAGERALWPPLTPDSDALDAALLQWRVYRTGQRSSGAWITSYLGRVYLGDEHARFVNAQPPVFPFAVLTRLDDGTLWGASPVLEASIGKRAGIARPPIDKGSTAGIARPLATLWSSRDGLHWHVRFSLDGSPGAVGSDKSGLWVAVTKPWRGSSMICVAQLAGDANPSSYPTGGSYDGEQIFFASLSSGLYLVWGATPGRSQSDQGALSAFRLDAKTLFETDGSGLNAYARISTAGDSGSPGPQLLGGPAMLDDTVRELELSAHDQRPVLATNISGAQSFAGSVIVRSLAGESAWQAEFGAQPSPLGIVSAAVASDGITVMRSVWLAPLRGHGTTERWQRDSGGVWRMTQIIRTWSL